MKKSELRQMIKEEMINEAKMIDQIYEALMTIPGFQNSKLSADAQGEIALGVEKLFKKYGVK
jgi:hypothetical protein